MPTRAENRIFIHSLDSSPVSWAQLPVLFRKFSSTVSISCTNPSLTLVDVWLSQNGSSSLLVSLNSYQCVLIRGKAFVLLYIFSALFHELVNVRTHLCVFPRTSPQLGSAPCQGDPFLGIPPQQWIFHIPGDAVLGIESRVLAKDPRKPTIYSSSHHVQIHGGDSPWGPCFVVAIRICWPPVKLMDGSLPL